MEFISNPDSFLRKRLEEGFAIPILLVLVAGIISSLTVYIAAPGILELTRQQITGIGLTEEQVEAILQMTYYGMLISPFVATFVVWIAISAILYVLSALFGGEGSFSSLTKLVAYSHIPVIILSPVSIYISYENVPYIAAGMKGHLLSSLVLNVSVFAWQAIYWIFALKNARNLSLKNSAIAVAIAVAIVFIAYLLLS